MKTEWKQPKRQLDPPALSLANKDDGVDQQGASPQLEDGYTRIANELLEALAALRCPSCVFRITLAVVRETYGYNRKTAPVSRAHIAEVTGWSETRVKQAVAEAVAWGVLLRDGRQLGLQKDHSRWQAPSTRTNTYGRDRTEKLRVGYPTRNGKNTLPLERVGYPTRNGKDTLPEAQKVFGQDTLPENGQDTLPARTTKTKDSATTATSPPPPHTASSEQQTEFGALIDEVFTRIRPGGRGTMTVFARGTDSEEAEELRAEWLEIDRDIGRDELINAVARADEQIRRESHSHARTLIGHLRIVRAERQRALEASGPVATAGSRPKRQRRPGVPPAYDPSAYEGDFTKWPEEQ